ncbi:polysaccharide deacetylase family protein [Aneurinibacillus sp. REN35]|uniref:polysaccharide deacetylase family protein n=1 Tax=Aneurinibacillus sp. REN35 TaxID=3237286 RepID=UPI00352757C3
MKTKKMIIYVCLLILCAYSASQSVHEQYVATNMGPASIHKETDYSFQDIFYNAKIKEKLIAFTFDDGPHPVYTRKVLKTLDKYQAKGTFFVTGQRAKRYGSIIKEMSEQGHEIGNHTFSHPSMRRITVEQLQEEIQKTDAIIHSLTGEYPVFFRPPGGVKNDIVIEAARRKKHMIVIWSRNQDTRDWSNPGIKNMVRQVTQHAEPGHIVLFHDSGVNRTQTVKALEQILNILSKKGYKFVTLSDLIHQAIEENAQ